MAWESSSSRCQVAIFYNTQTQWLDSSLIIKKGLCAFNNPGKGRIKQIFQELQHQRRVGGADSAHVWLARRWDDTVTAIFICKRETGAIRDGHEITAGFGGNVLKGASIFFFFFFGGGISHVCPTHTPDRQPGENRSSAVLQKKKKKLMWLTDLIVEVNCWALWRRICAA